MRACASHQENAEGYLLTRDAILWFREHYSRPDDDVQNSLLSPLLETHLQGLPPALVVTAEYDPLRDDGEAYATRMQEAGVPVDLRRYNGKFHGFFDLDAVLDQGKQVIPDCAAPLRQAFANCNEARIHDR